MSPRLLLDAPERHACVAVLLAWIADPSHIVQASALTALAELSEGGPQLRRQVVRLADAFARSDSPALRMRARLKLAEGG